MKTTREFTQTYKWFAFSLIWVGQLVSIIGSGFTGFALRVWAFENTGSVTQFAFVTFFYTLPGFLLSFVASAIVDRWDRRWIMILSDVGSGLSTLAIWILFRAGLLQVWHIYVSAAFMSLCGALQWPAIVSTTTLLVPKSLLSRVSGVMQIGPAVSQIIAPIMAGVLMLTFGLPFVILLDLITLVFAVIPLLLIRIPRPDPGTLGAPAAGRVNVKTLLREANQGWAYIRERPGLLGMLFFSTGVYLIQGMVGVSIAPMVLGFADASVLGAVFSVSGLGALLGALTMGIWGGPKRRVRGVVGFTFLRGLLLFLGGLRPDAALIGLASSVYLFCSQVAMGCSQTLWQRKTPANMQGRVFTVLHMATISLSFGQVLSGPLASDVFQPLFEHNGALANSIGRVIGTGPGRGIGFMLIVLGFLNLALTAGAYSYSRLRKLEDEVPDAIADDAAAKGAGRQNSLKRFRKVILGAVGAVLALVLILTSVAAWFVRRPWPQVDGTLAVAGISAPVEVIRDRWGVPHIYAQNEQDLFFTQGYVHAQDRLWQMEVNRRAGSGTLSAAIGRSAVNSDRYYRTLGVRRTAEIAWELLDDESRTILESYAAGVNAYIETHRDRLAVEFFILGVDPEPWTPIDSLVLDDVMALSLGANYSLELVRAQMIAEMGEQVANQLLPTSAPGMPLVIPDEVEVYAGLRGTPITVLAGGNEWQTSGSSLGLGSNAWAVHGSHTATGMPILANDMHLVSQVPSIWYENGLHGGRFDSVGYSFAGVPLIVTGHTTRIAWGATNLGGDSQDLYLEKLDSLENPTQYEFAGAWHDLTVIRETIEVKGERPETLDVLLTRHGPLVNEVFGIEETTPMSFRWVVYEGNLLFRALVQMNLATNWSEFRAALRYWEAPSQNIVYADVEGNIGYQATGKLPLRADGHQGTVPVPGWTGEYEWQGFIPFDELPTVLNPPSGFIATANNRIVSDDYPYQLADTYMPGYRAKRIVDLLSANDRLTLEDMQRIQADVYSLPAEMLRPYLLAVEPTGALQAQALDYVAAWDLRFETDRVGASIYQTWYVFMIQNTFGDELGDGDVLTQEDPEEEDLADRYLGGEYIRHGNQHTPVLIEFMADPHHPWFDDTRTPEVETRDDIVRRSLTDAVNWLNGRYGKNPENWPWGRMHTLTLRHRPLGQSGIPFVVNVFNPAPRPLRGDNYTVHTSSFGWTRPFAVQAVPSQRNIVDLSDLDSSLAVNATGQCEHIFHPHREDLLLTWEEVEYHPMIFTREAAEENSESVLTLLPK